MCHKIFLNDNGLELVRNVCNKLHEICSHMSAAVESCAIDICIELVSAVSDLESFSHLKSEAAAKD